MHIITYKQWYIFSTKFYIELEIHLIGAYGIENFRVVVFLGCCQPAMMEWTPIYCFRQSKIHISLRISHLRCFSSRVSTLTANVPTLLAFSSQTSQLDHLKSFDDLICSVIRIDLPRHNGDKLWNTKSWNCR